MKKIFFISLLYLIPFSLMAQKVSVEIIKGEKAALTEWQVLDEQYHIVFSGNEYFLDDSAIFSLESNKRYLLLISVSEIYNPDTSLYSLRINGEPIILINSDIGTGDHIFPFFTGVKDKQAKIIGGTDALISDFPWQVYLIAGNFRCGGSIINENWILTAAHCTKNSSGNTFLPSEMSVKVGANNPYNPVDGKIYGISEVIVHEGYNSQTLENDIALLKINEPVNFNNATPIKLISADDVAEGAINPGVFSWVTGWGLTNVTPKIFPTSLQKVQLPIVSNAQAATVWSAIPSTDIMAGYRNGNIDACSGDSGGPLVVPVLGEYKLAGIISWGSVNCNSYGGYTRVSDFNEWISTKTGIQIGYKPATPKGEILICPGEAASVYSIDNLAGATSYEWRLYPSNAGVVTGNSANASVLWNISYTGTVNVLVRVTINNFVSDWSKLTVRMVPNTRIKSQSTDSVLCAGQPVKLNVTAAGYNLQYNWYQNGQLIQAGSSNKLSILSTVPGNSGDYKCEVNGSCGNLVSGIMKLTVHPLTKVYYISPDMEVPFGKDAVVEVLAEGHDLMYQWEKDGTFLDNSNTSRLFLPAVNAKDIGLYQTVVTGTCGTKISDSVYVYVKKDNNPDITEVLVWPTITSEEFNVAISNDDYYNVHIFNTMGQLFRKQIKCQYQTTINVNSLPKGIYIINVFNKSFRKSIKLIKE